MDFSDKIAELCYEKYNKLGKTGKPIDNKEWTLLSAIISDINGNLEVVSLATGTKCIGTNSMRSDGTIVNDSHAEVLARRAFLRFIYYEIGIVKEGGSSKVIEQFGEKYRIKSFLKWHMFTSRVPCGDASIIPMEESLEPTPKRQRLDVHRTGAKPVVGLDPKGPGLEYHIRGPVRVKPGRGNPTSSLSCSDKMARWIYTGIQGALLSHLLEESIKLTTIVIGGGGPFDEGIIFHSLAKRGNAKGDLPKILQSSLAFKSSAEEVKGGKPAPASIVWCNVKSQPIEIGVEGRRQGSTAKNPEKGTLRICKRELFKLFIDLCHEGLKNLTYREVKNKAEFYQACFKEFKQNIGSWSEKPIGLERFSFL